MDLKEIIKHAELLKQVDEAPEEIKRLILIGLESAGKQEKPKATGKKGVVNTWENNVFTTKKRVFDFRSRSIKNPLLCV